MSVRWVLITLRQRAFQKPGIAGLPYIHTHTHTHTYIHGRGWSHSSIWAVLFLQVYSRLLDAFCTKCP